MPPALSPLMDALYHGRVDEAQRLLSEAGSDSLTIHEAAAMDGRQGFAADFHDRHGALPRR